MQNLSTFEEVLTHEIGHVLSMAHSSENPNETDTNLLASIMYYTVHGDGRGAKLGNYDTNIIQQVYPSANTPPYCYDRLLTVIHSPWGVTNVMGINSVELRGYDLQNDALTLSLTNVTHNNGTFSLDGQVLSYTPNGWFGSDLQLDPAGNAYYETAYARFSDATNGSPYLSVRIVSMLADTYPDTISDGIPDSWMNTYFGNPDPTVDPSHDALADADGDGESNLTEFFCGTDPTSKSSALQVTSVSTTNLQWISKPYDVYELQSSQDLRTWTRVINPIVASSNVVTVTNFATPGSAFQFFRVERVP